MNWIEGRKKVEDSLHWGEKLVAEWGAEENWRPWWPLCRRIWWGRGRPPPSIASQFPPRMYPIAGASERSIMNQTGHQSVQMVRAVHSGRNGISEQRRRS